MGLGSSPEKAEQLMDVCLANRDTKRNKVRSGWGGRRVGVVSSRGVAMPITVQWPGAQP